MLIEDLPPEILPSTFLILISARICAPLIGDQDYGSVHYPTLLSGVCAHWRRDMISSPRLWCNLNFTDLTYLPMLRRAQRCLERSQNSPLRIRVEKQDDECLMEYLGEREASLLRSCAPWSESLAICYRHSIVATLVMSVLFSLGVAPPIRALVLYAASAATKRQLTAHALLSPQKHLDQLLECLPSLCPKSVSPDWTLFLAQNW
jgi:hypothetical protein